MGDIVFVTGNLDKVHWVEKFLGHKLQHHKLDLDEIQDIDSSVVLEHKAKEAYRILHEPVLVEDVSVVYHAMGRLPGPFIKYFQAELGNEGVCRLLNAFDDRSITQTVMFGVFDGKDFLTFQASGMGKMARTPSIGAMGFGFDNVFIPEGYEKTRAEMSEAEYAETHPRKAAVMKLADFLNSQ